jgi:hypothetical protein
MVDDHRNADSSLNPDANRSMDTWTQPPWMRGAHTHEEAQMHTQGPETGVVLGPPPGGDPEEVPKEGNIPRAMSKTRAKALISMRLHNQIIHSLPVPAR